MHGLEDTGIKEPDGGLLWAFLFDENNTPTLLDGLPTLLDTTTPGHWYWLHFASAHEQARYLIRGLPNLPDDAKESLIDQDGGLRLDVEGDTV